MAGPFLRMTAGLVVVVVGRAVVWASEVVEVVDDTRSCTRPPSRRLTNFDASSARTMARTMNATRAMARMPRDGPRRRRPGGLGGGAGGCGGACGGPDAPMALTATPRGLRPRTPSPSNELALVSLALPG